MEMMTVELFIHTFRLVQRSQDFPFFCAFSVPFRVLEGKQKTPWRQSFNLIPGGNHLTSSDLLACFENTCLT
jgi:hypothetical protein